MESKISLGAWLGLVSVQTVVTNKNVAAKLVVSNPAVNRLVSKGSCSPPKAW